MVFTKVAQFGFKTKIVKRAQKKETEKRCKINNVHFSCK